MQANSFAEASCFGYLRVNVFSCAGFGFVQTASPLLAEGRLDYQPLCGAGLEKAAEIEPSELCLYQ